MFLSNWPVLRQCTTKHHVAAGSVFSFVPNRYFRVDGGLRFIKKNWVPFSGRMCFIKKIAQSSVFCGPGTKSTISTARKRCTHLSTSRLSHYPTRLLGTKVVYFWLKKSSFGLKIWRCTLYSATLIKNRGLTKPSTFHFPHNGDNLALIPDHLQAITHVLVFKLAKGSSILLSFILQGAVHA